MVSLRAFVCAVSCSALAAACSPYDESLVRSSEGCGGGGSAEPPSRPEIPDGAPEDDVPEIVVALRDVVLDTRDTDDDGEPLWRTTGFNLDRRCTTAENSLYACTPPGSNPQLSVDGIGGIDNRFGTALFGVVEIQYRVLETAKKMADPEYESYADTLQAYAERVMSDGLSSIVLRLRRWNGRPDDPSVTVDISQSVYGMPGDGTTNVPSYVPGSIPAWQGDDWFWVRSDTFSNGDANAPKTYDSNAFVRNGTIVMSLPDRAELIFVGPGLGLRVALVQATGTATIDASGRIDDVVLGGRWSRPDLLETSRAVGVCSQDTGLYGLLTAAIDNTADVRSDPDDDGDGAPCDALSFGVSFRAYPAHFAGLTTGAPLPDPCQ